MTNGDVVEWLPTGAFGIVKRAGSRSSKVTFYLMSATAVACGVFGKKATRQVKNSQLRVD